MNLTSVSVENSKYHRAFIRPKTDEPVPSPPSRNRSNFPLEPLGQPNAQKFSRAGFTIEFIIHRRGGRDKDSVFVRDWNITAIPLPFVNIMTDFPFMAECGGYQIKAPIPEAFFLHKLITLARRLETSKRLKDLEQCTAIASGLEQKRLEEVCHSVRLSARTWNTVKSSCEAIHFPPQLLGLEEYRGGKITKGR
jgi:hypothetical protein